MTYPDNSTLSNALLDQKLLEQLTTQGMEALPDLFRVLLNTAMQIERENHLGAAAYERTEQRTGHANGFKDKTLSTRLGHITVAVPQVREVNGQGAGFYPQSLERGTRSERALKLALAEMYVQGVSTRKVQAITEQLCGFSVSSGQVSEAAKQLDATLDAWRQRPLSECPYLLLDARYEKVRQGGLVQDAAVLIAVGIGMDGKRQVLGVSVALSEAEVHWRSFLHSLVARGLCGVRLVVSDAHEGLKAARLAVFGSTLWQRCQFHLQQNAQGYVPRQEMKAPVAADIRAIFNARDRAEAEALLKRAVNKYAVTAPRLSAWMEQNLAEGLTVFALPEAHRRLLRTTNGVERVNREVRRRTRVASIFPNEASCLRLVSAVLMEISDDWQAGKAYLTFHGPQKE
jgi:putative transposase